MHDLGKTFVKIGFLGKVKKKFGKKFNLTKLKFDLYNFEHNLFSIFGEFRGHYGMTSQNLFRKKRFQ